MMMLMKKLFFLIRYCREAFSSLPDEPLEMAISVKLQSKTIEIALQFQ